MGKKIGCGAYLENLIRTKIGNFDIKKAEELKKINSKNWTKKIIPAII
jgi:tRNA U55 pseudouridine synthase TruB